MIAALHRIASVDAWLERFLTDDTVLALQLLALVDDQYPELAELGRCLERVHLLLEVHLQRLQGAEIAISAGEYLVKPLPRL